MAASSDSSSLTHDVEEVDDALRIEQRIEAVVGPQLEQLAELALARSSASVLEQARDAQHAVRLHDLALALEPHLGVDERAQQLDGAPVLGAREGVPAALERLVRASRAPRRRAGRARAARGAQERARHSAAKSADAHSAVSCSSSASRRAAGAGRRARVMRSEVKASPESTATSISLLASSSAKKGTSISSPARAGGRRHLRFGSRHHDARAVATPGSVVISRAPRAT